MREIEAAGIAEQVGRAMGSEQGFVPHASPSPAGSPGQIVNRHLQGRVLREGDQFSLLVENNGPGGFYCELRPDRRPWESHRPDAGAARLRARGAAVLPGPAQARSGSSDTSGTATTDFMRENGRPEEKRVHFHGQGYDMVERPLIRFDETMPVGANMYFALHPAFSTQRTTAGPATTISSTPTATSSACTRRRRSSSQVD